MADETLTINLSNDFSNVSFNEDQILFHREKYTLYDDYRELKRCSQESCKNTVQKLKQKEFYKKILFKRLPILKWLLTEYSIKKYLHHDIVAGMTVGIMNMPQSMGYALLANLPAVHGLYMSFFPILIYFLLGTSKHLAIGITAFYSTK
jgi:hypothetical protein